MLNSAMVNKMRLLVFGNIFVEKDNIVLRIMPSLKKEFPEIEFKEMDANEDLQKQGRKLKIIDAAENLDKVREIKISSMKEFNKILTNKVYSMHDFDLGYNLRLLKKMNLIDEIEIICVPMSINEREALAQVQLILRKWVAQLMQGS